MRNDEITGWSMPASPALPTSGLEQLYLSARSRTGLEEYYTALGWTEVGRYPGGVRVAPGDDRDEVWFFRSLAPTPT